MKKRGEKLQRHYQQAFEYWTQIIPNRPRYVVLCNFDEFWIYDFDQQLDEPMDIVSLEQMEQRISAFGFLLPQERKPLFQNNRVNVTREAADKVAAVFNKMVKRGEDRERAQRFILQCVVAMFAEDADLLPNDLFVTLLDDCRQGGSTYDLIGNLFRQMNTEDRARGGRFAAVPYFNGGIFSTVDPVELTKPEIERLEDAAKEDWSKIQPAIFGTLFQSSLLKEERHALGAHFTSEADIQSVVLPTIVRPWRKRIEAAKTLKDLTALRRELLKFRVLDPACGSGNFLYVAFRELRRIELAILAKIHDVYGAKAREQAGSKTQVSINQFFGIELSPFGAELAKVTLMLAKELAIDEARHWLDSDQQQMAIEFEQPLPLDNLDNNILCGDALFLDWPEANAVVGNPPYQSKNKMQQEFGVAYQHKLRERFPDVPGMADYCVYWFRKAHDHLSEGGRAGLVGTNTIRQNYSREGSLDYIDDHGGTITEAISSQVWSGDAVVHVSIVNWMKGEQPGKKRLSWQNGDDIDSPWEFKELNHINSALSPKTDVTDATRLSINMNCEACYQGQTPGNDGFLLTVDQAKRMIEKNRQNAEVLFPYLTGDDLLSHNPPRPQRRIIDLQPRDMVAASAYKEPFEYVKTMVLPSRQTAAKEEAERNKEVLEQNPKAKVNHHHANFLKHWWLMSYPREELIGQITALPRYIACSRVTKRPIFDFVSRSVRPSDAMQVFVFQDDYSFGILQSGIHWQWFVLRCSTLKGDFRYTSNTVFDTFPWPQSPKDKSIVQVAKASVSLRACVPR